MKRIFVISLVLTFVSTSPALATTTNGDVNSGSTPAPSPSTGGGGGGNSAYQSSKSDQITQMTGGLIGVAMGAAIAKPACSSHPIGTTMCVIGVGEAAMSLVTVAMALKNTKPASDALDPCVSAGTCPGGGGGGGNGNGSGPTYPTNPFGPDTFAGTPYESDYKSLQDSAKQLGVDLSNPAAVQSFLDQNAGAMSADGMANLSPDDQALVDKAKAAALAKVAKYGVSSVGVESGGGGSMLARGGRDSSGLDLDGLMDKLDPNKRGDKNGKGREGLQRTLASGEAIGIATDNIFKIVSRRYQTKIQAQTFLK